MIAVSRNNLSSFVKRRRKMSTDDSNDFTKIILHHIKIHFEIESLSLLHHKPIWVPDSRSSFQINGAN